MLTRCTQSYGGTTVLDGAPPCRQGRDLLYVPQGHASGAPGLFDAAGAMVGEAGFLRGIPRPALVEQEPFTPLNPSLVTRRAPPQPHIYVGQIHHHFGHFLISCFSRLWILRRLSHLVQGCKILFLNPEPIAECFRHEHVRVLFGALGLEEGDFVRYSEPTIIPDAIVPAAAFVENHVAWREFAAFCNAVGGQIGGKAPLSGGRVYLTKEFVANGVSHVVNEAELTGWLAMRGVSIVAPERLSFVDQVALFRDSAFVAGLIGSAFHTSIFAPPSRLLMLNYNHVVWSNQLLLDGCNGNDSAFVHAGGDLVQDGADGTFLNHFRLAAPARTAERLLRAIDAFGRLPRRLPATEPPGSADARRRALRPLGAVLSRGRAARQSSASVWSVRPDVADDAGGAVSGVLTGRYQFHTEAEDHAWWQVDLGARCRITGVMAYNRQDVGAERANGLRLLVSDDAANWTELSRWQGPQPFGGHHGEPWAVLCEGSVAARFVRLELLRRDFLHLDQVEVFGLALDGLDSVLD